MLAEVRVDSGAILLHQRELLMTILLLLLLQLLLLLLFLMMMMVVLLARMSKLVLTLHQSVYPSHQFIENIEN